MRASRLTDHQVIRALNYNESLRAPDRNHDADSDAFIASLIDDEVSQTEEDEVWDHMVDLLEAGEIDFDDFRHQMRSAGYSDEEIAAAEPRP